MHTIAYDMAYLGGWLVGTRCYDSDGVHARLDVDVAMEMRHIHLGEGYNR